MERKAAGIGYVSFVVNGFIVPTILGALAVPALVIVVIAVTSIAVVSAWAFASPATDWRERMWPMIVMAVGVAITAGGSYWYYRTGQVSPPSQPPAPAVTPSPTSSPSSSATPPAGPAPADVARGAEQRRDTAYDLEAVNRKLDAALRQNARQPDPTTAASNRLRDDIQADLNSKRALVISITQDWISSNDGIPTTEAAILDKATPYISEQLEIRGQRWKFDREMRQRLGFPPIVGERY